MRLAICLYKLSQKDYNYTISEMTGVGESTVICIVNRSQKETNGLETRAVLIEIFMLC